MVVVQTLFEIECNRGLADLFNWEKLCFQWKMEFQSQETRKSQIYIDERGLLIIILGLYDRAVSTTRLFGEFHRAVCKYSVMRLCTH